MQASDIRYIIEYQPIGEQYLCSSTHKIEGHLREIKNKLDFWIDENQDCKIISIKRFSNNGTGWMFKGFKK